MNACFFFCNFPRSCQWGSRFRGSPPFWFLPSLDALGIVLESCIFVFHCISYVQKLDFPLACLIIIIYPIVLVLNFTRNCDVALHWGSGILYHLVGNPCFWILVDDNSKFCRRCVFYIMVITKKIKKIKDVASSRAGGATQRSPRMLPKQVRNSETRHGKLSSLAAWLRRGFPMTDWWWSTTCIYIIYVLYILKIYDP